MKTCPNCNAEIENNFEICWNCCYSLTENRVIEHEREWDTNTESEKPDPNTRVIVCLRCNVNLHYSGVYSFHEGMRLGFLGDFFELFVNRESFEIYICPKCGKVEFFVPLDSDKLREVVETEEPS